MRDPNSLRCLLDDDADAVRASRRSRRRSLAVSVSLQALFLSVLIVAPMIATGALPLTTNPPVIVYHGNPGEYRAPKQDRGGVKPQKTNSFHARNELIPPRTVPDKIQMFSDPPPDLGVGEKDGGLRTCPTCSRDGQIEMPPGFQPNDRGPAPPPAETRPVPAIRPVKMSEPVQEARLIHRIDPKYPVLCRQMRREGRVVLRAIVGTDGTMRELTHVSGDPCFTHQTLSAISQWRYRPTILNGQPVEVETTITVIYTLNR